MPVNLFPAKGFPIDELNRLALVSALGAHSVVKGLLSVINFKFIHMMPIHQVHESEPWVERI